METRLADNIGRWRTFLKMRGRFDIYVFETATVVKEPLATIISCYLGLEYRYEKVDIWVSYGLWHRSLLPKNHHKPCLRHLCKKRMKVYLKEPKNKLP